MGNASRAQVVGEFRPVRRKMVRWPDEHPAVLGNHGGSQAVRTACRASEAGTMSDRSALVGVMPSTEGTRGSSP